jgi:hypothetical protein
MSKDRKTKRELRRELERLGSPAGMDRDDLPPLTLTKAIHAEENDIQETDMDGVVFYRPSSQLLQEFRFEEHLKPAGRRAFAEWREDRELEKVLKWADREGLEYETDDDGEIIWLEGCGNPRPDGEDS